MNAEECEHKKCFEQRETIIEKHNAVLQLSVQSSDWAWFLEAAGCNLIQGEIILTTCNKNDIAKWFREKQLFWKVDSSETKCKRDYVNALLKIENIMSNDLVNKLIQAAELLWNLSHKNPDPGRKFIE